MGADVWKERERGVIFFSLLVPLRKKGKKEVEFHGQNQPPPYLTRSQNEGGENEAEERRRFL